MTRLMLSSLAVAAILAMAADRPAMAQPSPFNNGLSILGVSFDAPSSAKRRPNLQGGNRARRPARKSR